MAYVPIDISVLIETLSDSTRIEIVACKDNESATIYEGYPTQDAIEAAREYGGATSDWWWFCRNVDYIEVLSDGTLYIEIS